MLNRKIILATFVAALAGGCDVVAPNGPLTVTVEGPAYSFGTWISGVTYDGRWDWLYSAQPEVPPSGYDCYFPFKVTADGGEDDSGAQWLAGTVKILDPETREIEASYALTNEMVSAAVQSEWMLPGESALVSLHFRGPKLPYTVEWQIGFYDQATKKTATTKFTSLCKAP